MEQKLTKKQRLIERAKNFKQKVNRRSELNYELFLEIKLASPQLLGGCTMADAMAGSEKLHEAYQRYLAYDEGRLAQRRERYIVHEKLFESLTEVAPNLKIQNYPDPLSKDFDEHYYLFIGLLNQMGFELVNLDEASTQAVLSVFKDELNDNADEICVSQDLQADVITCTAETFKSPDQDATTANFSRIHMNSGAMEVDNTFSVLEKKQTSPTGTEKIEKAITYLEILRETGHKFLIHHNSEALKP